VSALVLKDLRVLRPWWWLILAGHPLFVANGIVSPETFFGTNVVLALAFTAGLLILDWKQEAERFVASLPVSRGEVVRARYLGALGAAVAGTVGYAVYGTLLLGLGTESLLQRWPTEPAWESPEGLLAFFVTVWLVSAAYLPFYFRAGLVRGTWLFALAAAPFIVGAVLLTRGWPGGMARLPEGGGSVTAVGATLLVSLAVGWLSLRLSIRFYEERDL
jgi:ABC-type transport system involved in multi-copper enzyme maturation permease subunit